MDVTQMFVLIFFSLFTEFNSVTGYKAAAFEHYPFFVVDPHPLTRNEALSVMRKNVAVYREQARMAVEQGAQIIVFPEKGIYGFDHSRSTIKPYLEPIPNPSEKMFINPCINKTLTRNEILQELSCIARYNSIALVANMGDIQYCTSRDPNCPNDGRYQFNTDVVFDTDGRLIAKYHKQHLFHEMAFNTPAKCEFVTFVTSFQVRFGVFTCFDMLFKDPAIDLVKVYGVKNIVFPSAWFKGFPMFISIGFQQAWSRTNCINLIAANLLYSLLDFTGSGIYSCGEVKVYTYYNGSIANRLLVSTLPENLNTHNQKAKIQIEILKQFSVENALRTTAKERVFSDPTDIYKPFYAVINSNLFTLIKLVSSENDVSVCGNGLCCSMKYALSQGRNFTETFAFGVFRGYNPNGYYWEVCTLMKCKSADQRSCGWVVINSETIFHSFTIHGNFTKTAVVFPTLLSSGNKLVPKDKVYFLTDHTVVCEAFEEPLLTANLIARVYSKDKQNRKIA